MAVTSYARLRMFWGALDLTAAQAQTPGYGPTQIVSGGSSAVIGSGVGVRRVTVNFNRTALHAGSDPATMHFDILNMTAGAPDDTWIASDFTNAETALTTFVTAIKPYYATNTSVDTFSWHRVGTGVTKPNPAERLNILTTPIFGSGPNSAGPPQMACSITFRTAVRRSWGRTYIPLSANVTATQTLSSTIVDAITSATNALVIALAAQDLHLVVVSKPLNSSLNVERVECDDNVDIIRRRRWKVSTYRKIIP